MAQIITKAITAPLKYNARVQEARATQNLYNAQASMVELQGRAQALNYLATGNEILRRIDETTGAIKARAAAGGINATSGSAAMLGEKATQSGYRELGIVEENAALSAALIKKQSAIYRYAGYEARRTGERNAQLGMATDYASVVGGVFNLGMRGLSLGAGGL